MLGIGSIIAHSVAIRKPWQRKCRSSSVHRGIAHGKQRVKVCKRKTPHLFWCGVFCPLAGISWNLPWIRKLLRNTRYRPLAGISWNLGGTIMLNLMKKFPSPCGDKLKYHGLWRLTSNQCFRPLAGISWNHYSCGTLRRIYRFRPLAGISWNTYNAYYEVGWLQCFRPLAGISWNMFVYVLPARVISFRPLAGISWNTRTEEAGS